MTRRATSRQGEPPLLPTTVDTGDATRYARPCAGRVVGACAEKPSGRSGKGRSTPNSEPVDPAVFVRPDRHDLQSWGTIWPAEVAKSRACDAGHHRLLGKFEAAAKGVVPTDIRAWTRLDIQTFEACACRFSQPTERSERTDAEPSSKLRQEIREAST